MKRLGLGCGIIALGWVVACGGDDEGVPPLVDSGPRADDGGPSGTDAGPPDAGSPRDGGRAGDPDGGGEDGGVVDGGVDAGMPPPRVVSCADPRPAGADVPDPLPTYAGTCPTLVAGLNTIRSGGADREFILVVPSGLDPSESLPLIFMWHWLGGSADSFLSRGEVQQGADDARFLAAIPEAKGDLMLRWPYLTTPVHSDARLDEEATFFDDVLACIAEQYVVDVDCVASAGVSAGALFTDQLAQVRSRRLASILSLSGGVGRPGDLINPVRPWGGASHAMPALVLWGGPTDFCGVDFNTASRNLEAGLTAGGHYIVECIHNCAHAQPPLEPPAGESEFESLWRFVLDHPYWLRDGESPYQAAGLPTNLPPWCGEGTGGATIRSGSCAGGPLGSCM